MGGRMNGCLGGWMDERMYKLVRWLVGYMDV